MDVSRRRGFGTFIEIPIFFILFSISLQGPVLTNLIIFRSCYANLGYNVSECALLGSENKDNDTQKLESVVQHYANIISMVVGIPPGIISTILALYIGSWSDKYGRKPVIVLTTAGHAISFLVITVFCLFKNLSAWYITLSSIPVVLCGGFASAFTVLLSYVTDITDENSRGLRMGIFEVVLSIGMLIGMISSSYIFNAVDYVGVFMIATGSYTIALLYTIFILEESLPNVQTEGKFDSFFSSKEIKDMASTTFKKRPNNKRVLILLCLAITSLFLFAVMSGGGSLYMYLRLKFEWTMKQFTLFTSVRDVASIFGTIFGIYFLHKKLKVEEIILILMGLISCLGGALVQGLATTDMDIYFGGFVRSLTGNVSPMLRSLISKIADADEVGKIFSILIMFENILQMLGSPLFTFIYNSTLDTHPEFFNFVTAGVLCVTVVLALIVAAIHLRSPEEPRFTILCEDAANTQESEEN
ncbi:proton-coupled folate transporter-like [Coccinella septempunctata]|uniref:proton-coupled folate transporter-like n=1 Tax=Coccinella septempunctata TaxID=41139 RepID=UPI001D060967|nr:proton-coupled folate transporter-like [Coccinella septempunctata]XP_044745389.1 proton-coupled folate transporter-like [Coccinella septempunctata]